MGVGWGGVALGPGGAGPLWGVLGQFPWWVCDPSRVAVVGWGGWGGRTLPLQSVDPRRDPGSCCACCAACRPQLLPCQPHAAVDHARP